MVETKLAGRCPFAGEVKLIALRTGDWKLAEPFDENRKAPSPFFPKGDCRTGTKGKALTGEFALYEKAHRDPQDRHPQGHGHNQRKTFVFSLVISPQNLSVDSLLTFYCL
jgi:hypothetical protein